MTAPVIHIENLIFRWARGGPICLDIQQLDIEAGARVFLHGPSGSGKSTLLGILDGVLTPERGKVSLLDTELTHLTSAARDRFRADHIGFVFQQFNLIPYLSVIDNVLLPCRFSARRLARASANGLALRQEAARLLSHLDLEASLYGRQAVHLSVGQQQRVAVARALIGQPEIVIADEPTSALDAERQAAFLDLLSQECQAAGSTLLFVSHDRRLAQHFSREVALPSINRAGREAAIA